MSSNEIKPNNQNDEKQLSTFVKRLTEPLSKRGWPVWLVYTFAIIGLIYILNPTAGIFEFIPDNIPLIGNLDEGVAFMFIITGLVEFFEGKKSRKPADKKNNPIDDDTIIDS
ncbi:MAG: DUF1232 domain-containing protein [Anaerolineaceae bacterium]|nr:DUF1232 domain-containing protein [Anaerolineaceae bacterium]